MQYIYAHRPAEHVKYALQPADIGLPTGNGKKLSCSQAQLGQATCLAVVQFLSISCGPFFVRRAVQNITTDGMLHIVTRLSLTLVKAAHPVKNRFNLDIKRPRKVIDTLERESGDTCCVVEWCQCTPHQKRTQDRFVIPATFPVPYEPPGSGLSENMKIKKNLQRDPH